MVKISYKGSVVKTPQEIEKKLFKVEEKIIIEKEMDIKQKSLIERAVLLWTLGRETSI